MFIVLRVPIASRSRRRVRHLKLHAVARAPMARGSSRPSSPDLMSISTMLEKLMHSQKNIAQTSFMIVYFDVTFVYCMRIVVVPPVV